MRRHTRHSCFMRLASIVALALSSLQVLSAADEAPLKEHETEFFESKIRPVLIKHCYECHAADAKSIRGGLLLDTRAGTLQGGDSGPSVVPGKPAESLLLESLRYESYEMPPAGKLPDEVIQDFETWIKMGAPDPRKGKHKVVSQQIDIEAGREFWSFQPVKQQTPPQVIDQGWNQSAIDRFIRARQKSLTPADLADRTTLVRRLYYDLTGLPPTPAQIDQYLNDTSNEATARLVDQLLASPHFGERWGRYWLDVARYSQSTGGGRSLLYNSAWRYRNYVIDAFNQDKPFHQFIKEQIAGDLLDTDDYRERQDQLIATAFLLLGPTNYEQQDKEQLRMDVIDEQIQTIGRAFLGMTLGCARCHDHKFDPIPATDYYALAGILRSTKVLTPGNVSGWTKRPLPLPGQQEQARIEYEQALAQLTADQKAKQKELKQLKAELNTITLDDSAATLVGDWKQSTFYKDFIGKGYIHDQQQAKGQKLVKFTPRKLKSGRYDVQLAYNSAESRASRVPVTIKTATGEKTVYVNQRVQPTDGTFASLGKFDFQGTEEEEIVVSNAGTDGYVIVDAIRFVSIPVKTSDGKAEQDVNPEYLQTLSKIKATQQKIKSLREEIAERKQNAPPEVPEVMSVYEAEEPGDYHLLIRGNVHQLGKKVPRGFITVTQTETTPPIPADASGRLQLAEWVASPENPLTARVYANRIWQHLFGSGLVRTVDNLGVRGETPSHPELLDYLAQRLIEHGWSTKALIREIVLSRTYQLSSHSTAEQRAADPDNRLLTHQNHRRLDAEAIRDTILFVSGDLDLEQHEQTVRPGTKSEYGYEFKNNYRSVYIPVFRNRLHELLAVFDFPDPNLSVGRRNTSTLSTQALYLMNNPFVMQQAEQIAKRLNNEYPTDQSARIDALFRIMLGRLPHQSEKANAERFLNQANTAGASDQLEAWTAFCQTMIACIDFRYLQ
ncbi:DUF1553 domain-containing protein [Gimesia panareensis]|uniref:Xanthan lyase n=1 Tax=Gimesia panareensis TaxID=2527978 RepID=A0A518A734_9PLAN|nr:DUF1553 domain-containing protein [Gimesia panareensis]QDT26595.1 Xanthan lyase precursor [Gimesia panareensis]QDU50526.1 Xanthan lyase precursor [Gimesia panareensis]